MASYALSVPAIARAAECERMLAKQPTAAVAIVCEPVIGGNMKINEFKTNFVMLPPTATVADLQERVREFSAFRRSKPLTITVNGCTPSDTALIGDLAAACRNEDGFLYVTYSGEKAMGLAVKCNSYAMDRK